jgi:hypothetical protein
MVTDSLLMNLAISRTQLTSVALRIRSAPSVESDEVDEDTSASHADCGSSFGNRIRLKAALAKTNSHSTFARPRSFTLRTHAIVFSRPKKQDLILMSWRFDMLRTPGVYRADVLMDDKVMWRGWVRVTP